MHTSKDLVRVIMLRPAKYNGIEIELKVNFANKHLCRADIKETEALGMPLGDTAKIYGQAKTASGSDSNDDMHFISVYLCENVLEDFIERFGADKINRTVTGKFRFVYAAYESNCGFSTEMEEAIGFQLVEILSDQEDTPEQDKGYFDCINKVLGNKKNEE